MTMSMAMLWTDMDLEEPVLEVEAFWSASSDLSAGGCLEPSEFLLHFRFEVVASKMEVFLARRPASIRVDRS
jgi:hypothetical protein